MTNVKKIIVIMSVTIVVFIAAGFALTIWFSGQFSATYPHIKKYEYPKTAKELEKDIIKILNSDSSFSYTITDSTGTIESRNYYMTIDQNFNKSSLSYHITYSDKGRSSCNLALVGVFNETNNTGGYKNEDDGVEQLVSLFDEQLADKIK